MPVAGNSEGSVSMAYRQALLIVGHALGEVYIFAFVSAARRFSTLRWGSDKMAPFMIR